MKNINVIKYNGKLQPYNREKIVSSLLSSGIKKNRIMPTLIRIESKIYDKIPTSKLYDIVYKEILNEGLAYNSRKYRFREVLGKIGSIDFEKFIKIFLEKKGYKCEWNIIVKGICVEHQVDIIASKNDRIFFVEVKHHKNPHRDCGLGYVAELWARLEDVYSGYNSNINNYKFYSAWLITNTKFSDHAKKYAQCKNLWLTGWKWGCQGSKAQVANEGLESSIDLIGEAYIDELIKKVVYEI